MAIRVFISSGGGVRIGASFGAELAGEMLGAFNVKAFDYFAGTSAGSLDAAMSANGWTGQQKKSLFVNTDFSKFFTPALVPFPLRELVALQWPISLQKLEAFYQSLCKPNPFGPALQFTPNLFINTVDTVDNVQEVYCRQAPEWVTLSGSGTQGARSNGGRIRWRQDVSLATAMVRSSVLPGLVGDDPRYMDGGVAENPLLSIFPPDANLTVIQLGYPGDTNPKSTLKKLMYAYDFKSYTASACELANFKNLRLIEPQVFDISSAAFNLSRDQKNEMVLRGFSNSREQWMKYL